MFISSAFGMDERMQNDILTHSSTLNFISPDLNATFLPFMYHPETSTLTMHVAKVNPQAKLSDNTRCLAIIDGAAGYISASYLPSKIKTGKVVPTWNYLTLNIYGTVITHTDDKWLTDHVTVMSDKFEQSREQPWQVSDAPQNYIQKMVKAIVGIELNIQEIQAKAKLSQNKNTEEQQGIITGLTTDGNLELAQAMEQTSKQVIED